MNSLSPSFYRLFRRSNYRTPLVSEGEEISEECTDERSERERFCAAAVGFTLVHSPRFRAHFWRTICAMGDSAKVPRRVELQPHSWADLLVCDRRRVVVVEFKVDCDVEEKQNPLSDAFRKKGVGYGRLARDGYRDVSDVRYVVLGSRKLQKLRLPKKVPSLDLRWQARSWQALEKGAPLKDPLTKDLLDSLGGMGIYCFRMKEIKKINVNGSFSSVGQAWDVIHALGKNLNFRWRIITQRSGPQYFYVGAQLKSPATKDKGLHLKLQKRFKGNRSTAWVGYDAQGQRVEATVYLICRDWDYAKGLEGTLKKQVGRIAVVELSPSSKDPHFLLKKRSKTGLGDYEWFETVLRKTAVQTH